MNCSRSDYGARLGYALLSLLPSTLAIVSASADTSIFVSLNEVPHPAKL
jgi:hypothetical protein